MRNIEICRNQDTLERERETEREGESERHRERERQRDTQTVRQTDKDRERRTQKEIESDRNSYKQIKREKHTKKKHNVKDFKKYITSSPSTAAFLGIFVAIFSHLKSSSKRSPTANTFFWFWKQNSMI